MIDVRSFFSSLKFKWVKRILSDEQSNWKETPTQFLKAYGGLASIIRFNLGTLESLPDYKSIPKFYIQIIQAWIQVNIHKMKEPKTSFDVRKQVIWRNQCIKHCSNFVFSCDHKLTIYYSDWGFP